MTIATLSTSVQQCINNFAAALLRNKTLILQCIGFTFLWGLIAHGFMFANDNLTHDSLTEIFFSNKIGLGRIFALPYTRWLRGGIVLPWLSGINALLLISVATIFVSKIFSIHSWIKILLICGIFTANITNIALIATYIHDLDADMFAMCLSVISVYCWRKYKWGCFGGSLFLSIALGLYQSYISTSLTVVIIVLILDLLQGREYRYVMIAGLKSIVMVLCAGVLYFCYIKIACAITGLSLHSNHYNSLDTPLSMSLPDFLYGIIETYKSTIKFLIFPPTLYPKYFTISLHCLIYLGMVGIIIRFIVSRKLHLKEISLLILLLLILPLVMNVSRILTNGMSHDLMHYALWLMYLLFILLIQEYIHIFNIQPLKTICIKILGYGLIFIILYANVTLANAAYLAKARECKAHLSYFTRLATDIETFEDYNAGETKVAMVGKPEQIYTSILNKAFEYCRVKKLTGMKHGFPILYWYYDSYFEYVLMNPIDIVNEESILQLETNEKLVKMMPCYPAEGSIQMIDSVLVVKLGEVEVQP